MYAMLVFLIYPKFKRERQKKKSVYIGGGGGGGWRVESNYCSKKK